MSSSTTVLSGRERFGAASGIVYGLLWLSSGFFSAQGPQAETATAPQIIDFFAQHAPTLAVGVSIGLISSGVFLVFLSSLHNRLQQAEGPGGWLSGVTYAGGLLTVGLFLAGLAMMVVPLLVELDRAPDVVVQSWYALSTVGNEAIGDVTTITRAMLIGAASLVMLRSHYFPRWLGWIGSFIALLSLVASLFPLGIGVVGLFWFVAFLLFPLWVLLTSIVLLRRPQTAQMDVAALQWNH